MVGQWLNFVLATVAMISIAVWQGLGGPGPRLETIGWLVLVSAALVAALSVFLAASSFARSRGLGHPSAVKVSAVAMEGIRAEGQFSHLKFAYIAAKYEIFAVGAPVHPERAALRLYDVRRWLFPPLRHRVLLDESESQTLSGVVEPSDAPFEGWLNYDPLFAGDGARFSGDLMFTVVIYTTVPDRGRFESELMPVVTQRSELRTSGDRR